MLRSRTNPQSAVRNPRFSICNARSGLTLFEMLLVIAVLAVAAGLSWPSIARIYALQQIREGAEMVQVRLASARALLTGTAARGAAVALDMT